MGDPDGPIIVTHKKPHFDEVVASWLLKTFDPAFKNCTFQFVSTNALGGFVPEGSQYVGLGVGRGKYDEHGLSSHNSATRLVYEDLLHRGLVPNDKYEDKAIEWLVDYAHKEDTGQLQHIPTEIRPFTIPAMMRGEWRANGSDLGVLKLGWAMVDAILGELNERAKFLPDWENRVEFESKWGKAVALVSTYKGSDEFAYSRGYVLRIQKDPTRAYGDFRAPATSPIDLTELYEKVNALEPGAWFLHAGKRMLIAGNDNGSGLPLTKLSLKQLIDLVKA